MGRALEGCESGCDRKRGMRGRGSCGKVRMLKARKASRDEPGGDRGRERE